MPASVWSPLTRGMVWLSRAARSRRRRRRRTRRSRRATLSEELPSIVLMLPSAPTDSTMPMCSSHTIRSPGCGGRARGQRLAGALAPGHHVVDAAVALTAVADRHAGLAGGPGDEVGAPRAGPGCAGRGLAVLGDARRVVGAGRLLGDCRPRRRTAVEHRLAGGGAAGLDGSGRGGGGGALEGGRERRRRRRGRRGRHGLRRREHRLQLRDAAERGLQAHRGQAATAGVRDLAEHGGPLLGGDLRAAVLGHVRLGGGADAARAAARRPPARAGSRPSPPGVEAWKPVTPCSMSG